MSAGLRSAAVLGLSDISLFILPAPFCREYIKKEGCRSRYLPVGQRHGKIPLHPSNKACKLNRKRIIGCATSDRRSCGCLDAGANRIVIALLKDCDYCIYVKNFIETKLYDHICIWPEMYYLATWAVMMNNGVKYCSMWRLANSKRTCTSSINGTVTHTPFTLFFGRISTLSIMEMDCDLY